MDLKINNCYNRVPFFESEQKQIKFEFYYLFIVFFICITFLILIHFKISIFDFKGQSKLLVYSAIGGL